MPLDRALAAPAHPIPPEADTLYARVRQAEGTAQGDGYLIYGGDKFTPGKEHPGELAKRIGPAGVTHAAGPGQWQPGTWNGLKPDFRATFGREPDFSSQDDQKSMVWLNAQKVYGPALAGDIRAGKLDTSRLAPQWAGFGGAGGAGQAAGRSMPGRLGGMGPPVPGGAIVPAPEVAAAVAPSRLSRAMATPETPGTPVQIAPAEAAPMATAAPGMPQLGPIAPMQVGNLRSTYQDALTSILSGRRRPFQSMFG